VPAESDQLKIYHASVDQKGDGLYLGGSRAVAVVGIGSSLGEAEGIAEAAACQFVGPVFHRKDIGTQALIDRRIEHMQIVRGG